MKLSDFILLDEEEKKQTVLHTGVLIGKRKSPASFAFLFQVGSFYVETFFDVDNKAVREFRMSDQTILLEPYLETIRLDEIKTAFQMRRLAYGALILKKAFACQDGPSSVGHTSNSILAFIYE
jgi:hypothetical protein